MEAENVAGPSGLQRHRKRKQSDLNRHYRRTLAKEAKRIISEVKDLNCIEINHEENENLANNLNCSLNPDIFIVSSDSIENDVIDPLSDIVDSSSSDGSLSSDFSLSGSPKPSLTNELVFWAKKHNVTNSATTDLLHILKPFFPNIPSDARTLLNTPREINVQNCCGGSYVYFGIEKNIIEKASNGFDANSIRYPIVDKIKTDLKVDNIFTMSVNVDGLPLVKSGKTSFWPVLGVLDQAKDKTPFIIAIYQGEAKPNNSNDFFNKFIEECIDLEERGIIFENTHYTFRISCFIADAPARAFLKCCVCFNSLHGCEKCLQEGVFFGRTIWQYKSNFALRNDDCFKNFVYKDEHQRCKSNLVKLRVGLVTQVPLDWMHMICLGVVKRLISVWIFKGPKNVRLSSLSVQTINERLLILAQHTPKEFTRKPRDINSFKFWKATEFRSFILYFGPAVLKDVLPDHLYDHFLLLHVAVYILCSKEFSSQLTSVNFADKLLHCFVRFISEYYCKELLLYNFHNLLHIVGDVVNFGPLDNFSSFPFENFMKNIKNMVRGPNDPLKQVAKRLGEISNSSESSLQKNVLCSEVYNRNVLTSVPFNDCSVGMEPPNNCFLTKEGDVIVIYSIEKDCKRKGSYVLKCKTFSCKTDWYTIPIKSSKLNIYRVKNLEHIIEIPMSYLLKKCILIPDFSKKHYFICVSFCNTKRFF